MQLPACMLATITAIVLAAAPVAAARGEDLCTGPAAGLGSAAGELGSLLAGAERVRRPNSLAGALGLWRVPRFRLGNFYYEQTLYFSEQRLQQIELLQLPDDAQDAAGSGFDELLSACREALGPELAARADRGEQRMQSASWASQTLDVMLLRSGSAARPRTRILYKMRKLKDADEL